MFKELHPLARQAQLLILVSAEGDQLRINITPKAKEGENPALATPLSLLATPEELDEQLPEILAKYSDAHMDLRASLGNAVEQIAAGKSEAGKKTAEAKPAAAKKADTKKPEKAKPEKPAAPAASSPDEKPEAPTEDEAPPAEPVAAETPSTPTEAAPPGDQDGMTGDVFSDAHEPGEHKSETKAQETGTEVQQTAPEVHKTEPDVHIPDPEEPAAPEKDPNTIELF